MLDQNSVKFGRVRRENNLSLRYGSEIGLSWRNGSRESLEMSSTIDDNNVGLEQETTEMTEMGSNAIIDDDYDDKSRALYDVDENAEDEIENPKTFKEEKSNFSNMQKIKKLRRSDEESRIRRRRQANGCPPEPEPCLDMLNTDPDDLKSNKSADVTMDLITMDVSDVNNLLINYKNQA